MATTAELPISPKAFLQNGGRKTYVIQIHMILYIIIYVVLYSLISSMRLMLMMMMMTTVCTVSVT